VRPISPGVALGLIAPAQGGDERIDTGVRSRRREPLTWELIDRRPGSIIAVQRVSRSDLAARFVFA
jgi:hypothetical protein